MVRLPKFLRSLTWSVTMKLSATIHELVPLPRVMLGQRALQARCLNPILVKVKTFKTLEGIKIP